MTLEHSIDEGGPFKSLPRPPHQLRYLPIELRWEVTRRHPVYQTVWNYSVAFQARNDDDDQELRSVFDTSCQVMLAQIGCSGPLISPGTEFEDIGDEELPEWMGGSIHPITNRGMLSLALATLSPHAMREISSLFESAVREDSEENFSRIESILSLQRIEDDSLNLYPDELIVSLSPRLSVKQFQADAKAALERFQQQREIQPGRIRNDKYMDYLHVWDKREGWHDGQYCPNQKKTLREIAQESSKSIQTIHNRYRCGFELITGHAYTPELWFRVMGLIHFTGDEIQEISIITKRRPRKSPTRREVPESAVSNSDSGSTIITNESKEDDNLELSSFRIDIQTLFKKGWNNEQIAQELNPKEPKPHFVQKFRDLFEDLPE